MPRRDTAYYLNKSSIFITEELRGVPYKWVSVMIAATYVLFGLRNIFFCGSNLPVGEGEDLVMEMWKDCKEDKAKSIFEGIHGLGDLLIAAIRLSMAMTASTADLFFTMLVLALYSTGFFLGALRVGITDLSWYYTANMFCGFFYENYVCYLAYNAYTKRNKMKKMMMNETEDIRFKQVFLVQAAGWALYAIHMFFFVETPFILVETEKQVSFFNSTWHDALSHSRPNIRSGWAHMGGVHAGILAGMCIFCYLTHSATSLVRAAGLVAMYHAGTMLLVLRAGVGLVPPSYLTFIMAGLVFDSHAVFEANKEVESMKVE